MIINVYLNFFCRISMRSEMVTVYSLVENEQVSNFVTGLTVPVH